MEVTIEVLEKVGIKTNDVTTLELILKFIVYPIIALVISIYFMNLRKKEFYEQIGFKNNNNCYYLEKEGYNFIGWYEVIDDVEEKVETITNRDYVLYAKWETMNYTISYDLNGGSCDNLISLFKYNEKLDLPIPEKEGYNFLCWYETIDDIEVKVETISNKDYNLIAKWEIMNYVITYDLDGGTCDNLITSFNHNEEITLPTPEKEGYNFLSWYETIDDVEVKVESKIPGTILYTTNGEMPTIHNGNAREYTEPIFLPVGEDTTAYSIKFICIYPNKTFSEVYTRDYIIEQNPERFTTTYILSLTGSEEALLGYEHGIFVRGRSFDEYMAANPDVDVLGTIIPANYLSDIELPVHAAIFAKDG